MSYCFIDDSVHEEAGFIIAACVFCKDNPSTEVGKILLAAGYDPLVEEYKSGTNFNRNPAMVGVRKQLEILVRDHCSFGLVVVEARERKNLGAEALVGVKQFINANELKQPISILVDQGFFASRTKAQAFAEQIGLENNRLILEQESVFQRGIQLSDLVVHTCSVILKEQMGLLRKKVTIGEGSGYDPDTEVELGYLLQAGLRYNIFHEKHKNITDDYLTDHTFNVVPYGLRIAEHCNSELAEHAYAAFSTTYLGCMH